MRDIGTFVFKLLEISFIASFCHPLSASKRFTNLFLKQKISKMLTGPYFKPFIDTLNLSTYSFALPFRWSYEEQRLVVSQSRRVHIMMTFGGIISAIYVFVLSYQLLMNFSHMSPALSMILIMWLAINAGTTYVKFFISKRQHQLRDFFNLMINFERNYFAGESKRKLVFLSLVYVYCKSGLKDLHLLPQRTKTMRQIQPCFWY